MNARLPIIEHLDHRIRVVQILLDISQSTFGSRDANLRQHLAELTNSRLAFSNMAPTLVKESGDTVTTKSHQTISHRLAGGGSKHIST